jgi:hypothetical protein
MGIRFHNLTLNKNLPPPPSQAFLVFTVYMFIFIYRKQSASQTNALLPSLKEEPPPPFFWGGGEKEADTLRAATQAGFDSLVFTL